MINTADMCANRIAFFEREKILRSRKLFNAFDIVPYLLVPCAVYWVLQLFIAGLKLSSYENTMLTLGTYLLFLLLSTIAVHLKRRRAKRKGESVILTGKEIESVFLFLLLLSAVFFFVAKNDETQADTKFFGAVSLTLYVGFTLSPKSLFSVKNLKHFINCFIVPLTNIFKTVHYMFFTLCVVIFGVICYLQDSPLVLCNLMIYLFGVLLIFCFSLTLVRNWTKASFLKNIEGLLDGKRILILQLGTDYIVGKALKQLLEKNDVEVLNTSECALTGNRYQIVIVLNSLWKKKEYLPKIDLLDSCLMPDGYIIDPFVTRNHRRAFLDAWFGVPSRNPELFTHEQYKNITHGNRESSCKIRRSPWLPVLAVTGIVLVLVPVVTYFVALLAQRTQWIPAIGSVDTWIAFAGSILGGSLTMLALVFTLHYERKAAEKAELQSIRPTLFCAINKEQFTEDYCEIILPECTNNYDFIRWKIKNVSENVANHIRIIDERTYINNGEALQEISSDTLLDSYGISIMTVSIQDYVALEPHGVQQCRTNFCLETDADERFKIDCAFDFINAITIEYTDMKGVGVYRSKFTFHLNINIDNKNKPCIFIESVDTTLLEV